MRKDYGAHTAFACQRAKCVAEKFAFLSSQRKSSQLSFESTACPVLSKCLQSVQSMLLALIWCKTPWNPHKCPPTQLCSLQTTVYGPRPQSTPSLASFV